ncbi:ALX-1 protein [Aphelenchoides avenae]|nr:ALX-1 protein [Aphelenchus avenae]
MVHLIGVPLKTTQEVDFLKALKSAVNSLPRLSKSQKSDAIQGLCTLNDLRNRTCVHPKDIFTSTLEELMRYYDQLVAIENKLPITPSKNSIKFSWKDSFRGWILFNRPQMTVSDSSFERASVLFNVGALMSQIAAAQKQIVDDELKTMARLFQQSAGVFLKLRDSVLGLVQQEPTADLMPETLNALSALMIAQAQEAIYLKAAKDDMKPESLAKIAAQVSQFYDEAQNQMNQARIKGIWEKEWQSTVAGKLAAYAGLAQFHEARIAANNTAIGEQIARLTEASKQLEKGGKDFANELTEVKKLLAAANKDNDFLYHERVPSLDTLPPVDKVALVKPTPVTQPMSQNFRDLFESSLTPDPSQNSSCAIM